MRIVIDMQGAQTSFSKHRGVGRYTMNLVKALAADSDGHEIYLALNGIFDTAVEDIRRTFDHLLPQKNICVWQQFYSFSSIEKKQAVLKHAAEVSREAFINSLSPDIIFSTNLQEGQLDPAPTSVKLLPSRALYCTTLHDVTPMIYPDRYLSSPKIRTWYDEKIEGVRKSDIILTVSEYSKRKIEELMEVPAEHVDVIYNAVDHLKFKPHNISSVDRDSVLNRMGIKSEFLLYAGGRDFHKNLDRLYGAFAKLPDDLKTTHQLVMVGKELHMEQHIHRSFFTRAGLMDKVVFTGYVSENDLIKLYNLCKLFVFPSLQEGFGLPALEAMACGAPVIAARSASLPEIIELKDALFDPHDEDHITHKIEYALRNASFREQLSAYGIKRAGFFSWQRSAEKLLNILYDRYQRHSDNPSHSSSMLNYDDPVKTIVEAIASYDTPAKLKKREMTSIAVSLSETYPERPKRQKKLFLDVSAIIENGDRTGIQRVVRSICYELLLNSRSIEVDIIYTNIHNHEFYRAGAFIDKIQASSSDTTKNDHIEFYNGDILLYLDLHPGVAISHVNKTRYLRNKGVYVYHIVYDLLPEIYPQFFWPQLCEEFTLWLKAVAQADGAICISRAVATELQKWFRINQPECSRGFKIGWFHLGADIEKSIPSYGIPSGGDEILDKITDGLNFLVVGTIEPRKGYEQILSAFDILWDMGREINLIIIGKYGWGMERMNDILASHPQRNKRLFWLEGISDEFLLKLYRSCNCLIAASHGEGFGLPIIEAAKHEICVIARDIPVFREVAGDHAFYFKGTEAQSLADAIQLWIELYREEQVPRSSKIKLLTWRESSEQLMDIIKENKFQFVYHTQKDAYDC